MRQKISIALVALALSSIAAAHSGGTDAYGCHHKTSDNTYHCHNH